MTEAPEPLREVKQDLRIIFQIEAGTGEEITGQIIEVAILEEEIGEGIEVEVTIFPMDKDSNCSEQTLISSDCMVDKVRSTGIADPHMVIMIEEDQIASMHKHKV